jgi:ribosomal peptide maturation radical SAM protein 1
MRPREIDLRFVVTPFLPEHQPALGVSSLKAVLSRSGIRSDILYFNLDYAERIGTGLNRWITETSPHLLIGESVFAGALWGDDEGLSHEYEARLLEGDRIARRSVSETLPEMLPKLRELRRGSQRIAEGWARKILEGSPRVVGFTTTFQQSLASLAVARELRRLAPPEEVAIIFGGANCEGDMGRAMADHFPFIDHVVSGEGEGPILEIARHYLEGGAGVQPPARCLGAQTLQSMDALPTPDFDDYFAAVRGTCFEESANLVAESSRGCWWGMKSHCTFCGLNGGTMQFRSKKPARFASEIRELSRRYGRNYFAIADNILDMKYIQRLFPDLAARNEKIKLFYEVKANLRKDQLEMLAAGGIYRLQPGIESFSTPILKRMAKGTSRLQNVQLIKWCREFKISVAWNLLFGFPGEEPEEYAEMAKFIPALVHLEPPVGYGHIRLDRFSPYWKTPERYGIGGVRHYWGYDFIYHGVPAEERSRLAYYFEHEARADANPADYARPVMNAIDRWLAIAPAAKLEFADTAEGPAILDTRWGEEQVHLVSPLEQRTLRILDAHCSRDACVERLGREGLAQGDAECERMFQRFVDRAWVVCEGNQMVSLVVDRREFERVIDRRLQLQLEALGLAEPECPATVLAAVPA